MQRLNVADLNAIETRVASWVSGCEPLLAVFQPRPGKPNGNDPYIEFSAVKLMGLTYEKLEADLKSKDKMIKKAAKDARQMGKVGVLGCVYRMGGGGWGKNKYGDDVKTGLWNYAEGYGVQMEQHQAHHIVQIFRESYLEIKQMWFDIEEAYTAVLAGKRVRRELGPGGCIKFDKLTLNQNGGTRDILRIQLPSGRYIHYFDASIQDLKKPWKDSDGNDVYGPTLTYSGVNQTSHQWMPGVTSHGGKVCLTGDTLVVTNKGLVKLQDVCYDHLLWDGVEFVQHEGLIYKGTQEVGICNGLKGTANHLILAGSTWKKLAEMDKQDWRIALSLGRDLAPSSCYLQKQAKKEEQNYNVIAEKYSMFLQGRSGEGRRGLAHPVDVRENRRRLSDILSFLTKDFGIYGFTEEQESYLDVQMRNARPTLTMAAEELPIIRNGTISTHGCVLLSLYQTGIIQTLILTELRTMGIMIRQISGWFREKLTAIIDEVLRLSHLMKKNFHIQSLGENIFQTGLQTPSDIISVKEKPQSGVWTIIGKQEVFDLLNCGPRNRFMVITELGPALVHNCENIVQGIARDVLAVKMLQFEEIGIQLVGHVHDEGIGETPDCPFQPGVAEMIAEMSRPVSWAPGLLLGADGFESPYYKK